MTTMHGSNTLVSSVFAGLALALLCAPSHAIGVRHHAEGPDAASIQAGVDAFRALLGNNNGVGGTFPSGRREINWDGVPDNFAAPNVLPNAFFNVNSPRGVVMVVGDEQGTGFNRLLVSADQDNPTLTPLRFGNIEPGYPTILQTFSAERLFQFNNSRVMEITFYVPGTALPATVAGFGVILADVDIGTAYRLTCYAADGAKLVSASPLEFNNGLSFVGIAFTSPAERCARVTLITGTKAFSLGLPDNPSASDPVDIGAMDDFIYGEPRFIDVMSVDGFE